MQVESSAIHRLLLQLVEVAETYRMAMWKQEPKTSLWLWRLLP
jgi:hypothetical protein